MNSQTLHINGVEMNRKLFRDMYYAMITQLNAKSIPNNLMVLQPSLMKILKYSSHLYLYLTIMAARLDKYKLVIIFSKTFLIDPSKCSFLISTNDKNVPYYPKLMSYKLDPQENYKIALINSKNTYNLREQIFINSFERQVTTGSIIQLIKDLLRFEAYFEKSITSYKFNRSLFKIAIVPILICPKQLLSNVWEYFIEQDCYIDTLEELQEALMMSQRQVQLGNAIIANTLINGCALFQKYIQIKPKFSRKEIESDIMNLTFSDLENSISQFKGMPIMISQNGRFVQQLMILVKNMISQFFNFIEETIDLLQLVLNGF